MASKLWLVPEQSYLDFKMSFPSQCGLSSNGSDCSFHHSQIFMDRNNVAFSKSVVPAVRQGDSSWNEWAPGWLDQKEASDSSSLLRGFYHYV